MSRTSRTVVCKEGPDEHTLCSDFPNTGLWIYCCNCQTFIAWDTARTDVSVRECPFCLSSLSPRLYCCDHCAVTMLDFDDPTLRKHHTVLSWGMPQPACPGCHQFPRSTPQIHFCPALQCNLATARSSCPFCRLNLLESVVDGVQKASSQLDAALADAEARAREAEERRRLAEDAARKEVRLRVEAEKKAIEIEKKVTRELSQPPSYPDAELAKREAEYARARAESEARARSEAEAKAREAEQRRLQAEAAARREAEMRAFAEQNKAEEIAGAFSEGVAASRARSRSTNKQDRITIALFAAIATFLALALFFIIITMIRLYNS